MSSVDLLISLGALIVAVVALVLGRLDRRRDRIKRQARSVSVAVEEAHRQTSEHSYTLHEWKLDVHNHSDLPIKINSVVLVLGSSWEDLLGQGLRELPQRALPMMDRLVRPGEGWTHTITADEHGGFDEDLPSFAVVRFLDQENRAWERRSDTYELRREDRPIRWWQSAVQTLDRRVPGFGKVVLAPIIRSAVRSASNHGPDHMPRALRLCRWLWGYWPAGEVDPWMRPDGAPALWGFEELQWGQRE